MFSAMAAKPIPDATGRHRESPPLPYGGKVFRADQVRAIFDNLCVIVSPHINPDGKLYSPTATPM